MRIIDALYDLRETFRRENIAPPSLIVLASAEQGIRLRGELAATTLNPKVRDLAMVRIFGMRIEWPEK